jgi:hypothetical protein
VRGRSVILGWREASREKGEGCKKAIPGTPVTENKSRRKTLDYRNRRPQPGRNSGGSWRSPLSQKRAVIEHI